MSNPRMIAIDAHIAQLRRRVGTLRETLDNAHAAHTQKQLEDHGGAGEECEGETRKAGESLRLAMAELRGAENVAKIARDAGLGRETIATAVKVAS